MEICKKELCTGCGGCVSVCSKGAIKMKADKYGFYYPTVDNSVCVACGECVRKCPGKEKETSKNNIHSVFAAWNKNRSIRKQSTSGGIFFLLAEHIIQNGGVVAGVQWNAKFQCEHVIIDKTEDLYKLSGSKYVQSHANYVYKMVKSYLEEDKQVLFSGTPCQNHALKKYLGREYENLYLVDLICHGVPSDGVLQRYLYERTNAGKRKVMNIRFRHKRPYWDWCNVTINFSDGTKYSVPTPEDSYFTLFNVGFSLRQSCTRCQYTNQNRFGDITLADFWGYLPKSMRMQSYLLGTSLVLVNSEQGEKLLECVKKEMVLEPSSIEAALRSNKSLTAPFSLPEEKVKAFWEDYEKGMTIDQLHDKYTKNTFSKPKLLWIRRLYYRYKWVLKK